MTRRRDPINEYPVSNGSKNVLLVATTEGSTRPVTIHITNAGIAIVVQYDLRIP